MKHTPLYNEHIKLGARMVDFGGWEMPIQYSGVIDEHRTVRASAGIFDVSHMGQFEFKGPDALSFVQYLTTNDAARLADGQAAYSLLCSERGTLVDDIIVYKFNNEHITFVVNAGNVDKDWAWVTSHKKGSVEMTNRSSDFALIALQGPKAAEILARVVESPSTGIASIKTFHMAHATVAGVKDCILARTGYTGEDGFEIFITPSGAPRVWQALLTTGAPFGLKPIGLGARDTLRLEMRYSLYGHEITQDTNALEAGLGWAVKFTKDCDFIGRSALEKIKAEGLKRKCVGFKMIDAGIPREHYKIFRSHDSTIAPSHEIGFVCSGTMSPSLNAAIGTGYVPLELSRPGSKIFIDIRGQLRQAEIVQTPFYKKS
jgi:aminomethyltransferase